MGVGGGTPVHPVIPEAKDAAYAVNAALMILTPSLLGVNACNTASNAVFAAAAVELAGITLLPAYVFKAEPQRAAAASGVLGKPPNPEY
jgi:hypothetical protein